LYYDLLSDTIDNILLFRGQECAELRIPWENVQPEKQKSICEANFAWIFACYWNGVNSNDNIFI
jgi:hypothetical protein